jgi:hypothetical protein
MFFLIFAFAAASFKIFWTLLAEYGTGLPAVLPWPSNSQKTGLLVEWWNSGLVKRRWGNGKKKGRGNGECAPFFIASPDQRQRHHESARHVRTGARTVEKKLLEYK